LEAPVIALSQLSRDPEKRGGDHRPQLADLRESGSIEQDADVVMFVFREEVYKPDEPELNGMADIIVAKQRNGPTGKVKLTFLKDCTRFEDGEEEKANPDRYSS
jgi:replicative DNA helicase